MKIGNHLKIHNSRSSAGVVQDALRKLDVVDDNTHLGLIPYQLLRKVANSRDSAHKDALRIAEKELNRREISSASTREEVRLHITRKAIDDASKVIFHAYASETVGFLTWLQNDVKAILDDVDFCGGRGFVKHRGLCYQFVRVKGVHRLVSITQTLDEAQSVSNYLLNYDEKSTISGHALNRASLLLREEFLEQYLATGEGLLKWLERVKSHCEKKLLKGQNEIVYNQTVFIFSSTNKLITIHARC